MDCLNHFYALLGHNRVDGVTALVAICTGTDGKKTVHREYITNGDDLVTFTDKYNGKGQCYISLNPIRKDINFTEDHRDEDVTYVMNILIDVDSRKLDPYIDDKEVSRYAATDEEKAVAVSSADVVEEWLKSRGFTYYRDDTGNGSRFILGIPPIELTRDNINDIKARLKRFQYHLKQATGVDIDVSVHDPRRITGIPGTLNVKKESVTRKNRMRIPSLPIPERVEDSRLRDFILTLEDSDKSPKEDIEHHIVSGYSDSSRKIDDILQDWIEYDNLKHKGKLGRLLRGEISEYDRDRSRAEQALYNIMLRYRFTDAEIEQQLSRGVIGKWGTKDGGQSYQRATRDKAHSSVQYVSIDTYLEIKSRKEEKTYTVEEILSKGADINSLRLTINLPENHFIMKFVKWLNGVTDAYQDYSIMCALWLLSAACQGKVCLKLKQGTIYPNLYILLLGLSTISRKTTVINKTRIVFESCTQEKSYNDDYSLEGYLELLQDKAVCNMIRDEVVGLFQKYEKKYNDGIHEAECAIYDGGSVRKTLSSGRNGKKKEVLVNNPYVTHLYATTPYNFSSSMSLENFYSGFGFRFLYCHPRYNRPRMALAVSTAEDKKALGTIVTDILHLWDMFAKLKEEIEFTVDYAAMEYLEQVRIQVENIITETNDNNISSAWGRNCDHILKLCMLIEIGKETPSFNISLETMKEACRITTGYFLPVCIETLQRLQEDTKNNKIEKVRSILIRNNGTCSHSQLLRNSNLVSRDFNEVISTMIESKEIEIFKESGSKATWYVLIDTSTKDKLKSVNSICSGNSVSSLVSEESNRATNSTNSESGSIKEASTSMMCATTKTDINESTNNTNSANQLNFDNTRVADIIQFCNNWVKSNNRSISRDNIDSIALEYCKMNSCNDVEGVKNIVRHFAAIPSPANEFQAESGEFF